MADPGRAAAAASTRLGPVRHTLRPSPRARCSDIGTTASACQSASASAVAGTGWEHAVWTWRELEALFESAFGPGCGAKRIERDGFRIYRHVRRQPSETGGADTWLIDYRVVAPDGTTTRISDPGVTSQAR
jgi:hypothetical protein